MNVSKLAIARGIDPATPFAPGWLLLSFDGPATGRGESPAGHQKILGCVDVGGLTAIEIDAISEETAPYPWIEKVLPDGRVIYAASNAGGRHGLCAPEHAGLITERGRD